LEFIRHPASEWEARHQRGGRTRVFEIAAGTTETRRAAQALALEIPLTYGR
jgi:hypothetical protein